MATVERVEHFQTTIGGQPHTGWLPPRAAVPPPTPARTIELTLTIDDDGGSGFLLIFHSPDNSVRGDTWHRTIEEAREAARDSFGVPFEAWRAVSDPDARTP
jgi:hypothetical protein